MQTSKKWSIAFLAITLLFVAAFGAVNAIIDPCFHYHPPLRALAYPLGNQRYQNYGIARNFDYDAIITGTSMTENFKTSELDALFGTHSIKTCFSGGSFKEINDLLAYALRCHPDTRLIVRGLDSDSFLADKDSMRYMDYPTYLYDDDLLNDINYVLNKTVFFQLTVQTLQRTLKGLTTPSFDAVNYWSDAYPFGREAVLANYARPDIAEHSPAQFTEAERTLVQENLEQNVIALVKEHPDTTFYFFLPPYSILYWDRLQRQNCLEKELEIDRCAIEQLLEYDNIKLFAFFDEFEMVCDLDNYRDIGHYNGAINSRILEWMANSDHQLTKENYLAYFERLQQFYLTFDYDTFLEQDPQGT